MSRRPRVRTVGFAGAALVALAPAVLQVPGAAAEPGCADLLVSHSPDGSVGDTTAVVITAQTIERGTPGWASVAWEVAADTRVRAIHAATENEVLLLDPDATSVDVPVGVVRFCGTTGATGVGDDDGVLGASAPPGASSGEGASGTGVGAPTARRRGTASGGVPASGLIGAAVGAAAAGVVLVLSRSARNDGEAAR